MRGIRIDDNPDTLTERDQSYEWGGSNEEPRDGVSVCETWDDLVSYFSEPVPGQDGGRVRVDQISDSHLVVVEGQPSDDRDHDHGGPGEPYLLCDIEVVESRKLTPDDVRELVWGVREPGHTRHLVSRLEEMREVYDHEVVEQTFDLEPVDGYDLSQLLRNPGGSYVVVEGDEECVIWDESNDEYGTVPTCEIK